jgi:hypothetical protein
VTTACSTADYSKPVNDFAAATSDAQTALSQLNTQVTEAYGAVLETSIIKRRVFLKFADNECLVPSERCRLIVQSASGKTEPYPPQPPLAQMSLVMAEISKYAANLKALVEADTAQQAEGQVNAALGSIQNLAQTVADAHNGGTATSVPQFATPVGAAVNWVIGQYVEHVKFRGLQRATETAKPVIRDAANLFSAVSSFVSDVPKSELAEEVSSALDAFRATGNEANLDKLAQSAAKYDALLTSAPPQLFQHMAAAHDALADSLQNKDVTFSTVVARIEAFGAEAKNLATILNNLRAISPAKKEG